MKKPLTSALTLVAAAGILVTLAPVVSGCSDAAATSSSKKSARDGGSKTPSATSGRVDGGEDDDAGAPPSWASGPRASCERYIACAESASPEGLALILDAYGEGGSCWSQRGDDACEAACENGLDRLGSGKTAACNFCKDDEDCEGRGDTSVCDTAKKTCVPCGGARKQCLGRPCGQGAGACAVGEVCPGGYDPKCVKNVQGKTCSGSDDCGTGFDCRGGACRLKDCSDRDESGRARCGAGEVCSYGLGSWGAVRACVPDLVGQSCQVGVGVPVCGGEGSFACVVGACRKICGEDEHCPVGQSCVQATVTDTWGGTSSAKVCQKAR